MQSLRNHVIICGWKNNQKGLILDIKRKNKELKLSDIVLINNRDEEQIRFSWQMKSFGEFSMYMAIFPKKMF